LGVYENAGEEEGGGGMTGEKNRYKTLEKLAKLEDRSLSTPAHDELTIKLLDKEYLKTKFPEIKSFIDTGDLQFEGDHELTGNEYGEFKNKWINKIKPDLDPYCFLNVLSEVPIKGRNGYIIGYWDIVIYWPKVIGFPFLDGVMEVKFKNTFTYFIEVKPKINSFGETLRQINTYREFVSGKDKKIVLFTPDTRFKGFFENQGVLVVEP
jgi:hypothetical protein